MHDLRVMWRRLGGRNSQPSAAVYDKRTLQPSPEERKAGRVRRGQATQGQQGARGSGHPGAPASTWSPLPMSRKERKWPSCPKPCGVTGKQVEAAFVDRLQAEQAAAGEGIELYSQA